MKILVTGANGYLGSGIVKKLLDNKNEVIAVDFDDKYIDKRATTYICDIFELDNPMHYFGNPDAILHLAWKNGFVHNDSSHIDDLHKHFHFIEKFINSGIKKVAIMGTMHEIGFYEGSIDENTPTKPQSLYGISKNSLREAVCLLCKQNNVTFHWYRGFYIVGKNENGSSIFSKIVKAEKNGDKYFPFTLGQNQWDFIDYDDFCNQISSAIIQDKINGIINICSGRPEKLSDRVEKFIKDNNYSIKLEYGKFKDRPYDSKAVWGNDTKIRIIIDKTIINEQK